jgi:hypothetical protein
MVRHRIYLEHLKSRAEKEYERSCKTLKIERVRTKTYPEGRKADGQLITETTTDVYPKHQLGRVSFLHFIDKVERELAGLDAGWLGSGNKNIPFNKVIDAEERDRWDRHVKWQQAQIAELQAKLAKAEAKAATWGAGPPQAPTEGLPIAGEGDQTLTLALSEGERGRAEHESENVEKNTDSGLKPPIVNAPTPVEPKTCSEAHASELPRAQEAPKVNKTASAEPKLGWAARLAAGLFQLGAGLSTPPTAAGCAEPSPSDQTLTLALSQGERGQEQTPDGMLPPEKQPQEDPRPRWEDEYRQEALDYHCLIHGLPPASLEQATGIPDPKTISPRMWIEKGRPYMIYIDRSIPCDRVNPLDTRKLITLACPVAIQGPSTRVYGWPGGTR